MKYYLKEILFPLVYAFFMALLAICILLIDDSLMWLKVLLLLLNLGLYAVIMWANASKVGADAMKLRYDNDLLRREIIRTGRDIPIDRVKEYKFAKGFFIGLCVCAPLILLMLIHTVLILAVGPEACTAGRIAGILYSGVFAFFLLGGPATTYSFYFSLFYIVLMVPLYGVPYNLGALKIKKQQDEIAAKNKFIHGDEQ